MFNCVLAAPRRHLGPPLAPFFWELDALIAISTRPAGQRPPNNMAPATVSVSTSDVGTLLLFGETPFFAA